MTIRIFDIVFAILGIVLLLPIMLVVAVFVKITSHGPVLYKQSRVGINGCDFKVLKFRSMYTNADNKGLLTVGGRDSRITTIGYYLRKYKIDELPQLFNVLVGEMSMVGPRPEVRRYVDLYSYEQKRTLSVLPGITDYASLQYRNENELLALANDPEEFYIREIMPKKIALNFYYIDNRSLKEYLKIITKTLFTAVKGR